MPCLIQVHSEMLSTLDVGRRESSLELIENPWKERRLEMS